MLFLRLEILEEGRAVYAVERLRDGVWRRAREILVERETGTRKLMLAENERVVVEAAEKDVLLFDKEQMSVKRERGPIPIEGRFDQEPLEVIDAST